MALGGTSPAHGGGRQRWPMRTPLERCPRLSKHLGIDLRVKRDDLFPFFGGGNKARKILGFVREAEALGCNALITTGGLQSNHARVTALAAASKGWLCKLVLHGDPRALHNPRGNLLLMLLAGAEVIVVSPDQIRRSLEIAERDLVTQGHRPLVIPGGAHSLIGALAYVEAAQELLEQCEELKWYPSWLILPSGTGTTQAGLVVGLERAGWQVHVVGISVARHNPRGQAIIEEACRDLRKHLGMDSFERETSFRDEWVGEGYEKAYPRVWESIRLAATLDGLILDPTYTGKAFAGMIDMLASGEIERGAKVLFWHTGGLFNLMAADFPCISEVVQ